MRIIFVLLLFIVEQQLIRADDEQDEWKYPPKCAGYGCDYRAQWWYLEKTDEIKFVISTKFRNKWTGIGFSDSQQMKGTDAVLGLVEDNNNGRYFLMDTYLSNYNPPPLDAVQNIHNMTVWRENGITHLQFHRFRTTSDPEYDFQFTDDHCPYFLFPIRGGVFNAVNKRMRKHEEKPIISKERICIRSKDPKQRKKVIEVPPPIRFNVPNKPKIPTRFKARPKLTSLLAMTTTSTTTTTTSTTSTTTSTTTPSSIVDLNKSPEPTTNNPTNLKPNEQLTTLPVLSVDNDRSIDQVTSKPTTVEVRTNANNSQSTSSTTQSPLPVTPESIATSVSSNANENVNSVNSNENAAVLKKASSEPKNEDKLEYGDEEDDVPNESKKPSSASDDKSEQEDGRISTDTSATTNTNANHPQQQPPPNEEQSTKIKSFNFDLKILNSASTSELNSTAVHREAEKELSDITGFRQLKLITFKPITSEKDSASKPTSWIADFEMQVHTEPDTNETDYLAYLQNALNETVTSGHIGNLMLDTSYHAQLRQDFNQTKQPEAKYVFEYNFFNQLTIKLTKEQLKLAYIVLGVSLLVLLVLMQACCMCCTSNESNSDLHKQNNLSNSSTLQDKHQLNMHHHHAQYNDYIKNCGGGGGANNYSYENFALDASDVSPGYDSSYKMKHKHSLSKHDPMLYSNNYHPHSQHPPQNYHQNSYNRRPVDFGYNSSNFNNYHHNHHSSSSHHRYFEPQPMHSLEQPDFYFMPKQRINHKCYN